MKIEQVPKFKRSVKRLKRKHKLGIVKNTYPTVWHVHVDRNYNDNWILCYRLEKNGSVLLLLITGGHKILKNV